MQEKPSKLVPVINEFVSWISMLEATPFSLKILCFALGGWFQSWLLYAIAGTSWIKVGISEGTISVQWNKQNILQWLDQVHWITCLLGRISLVFWCGGERYLVVYLQQFKKTFIFKTSLLAESLSSCQQNSSGTTCTMWETWLVANQNTKLLSSLHTVLVPEAWGNPFTDWKKTQLTRPLS